jgi:hypothetical protein
VFIFCGLLYDAGSISDSIMNNAKRPLGRPRRRWNGNIKMDLRHMGLSDMDCIDLSHDRDHGNEPLDSIRWFASSSVAVQLADTQEGLSSTVYPKISYVFSVDNFADKRRSLGRYVRTRTKATELLLLLFSVNLSCRCGNEPSGFKKHWDIL